MVTIDYKPLRCRTEPPPHQGGSSENRSLFLCLYLGIRKEKYRIAAVLGSDRPGARTLNPLMKTHPFELSISFVASLIYYPNYVKLKGRLFSVFIATGGGFAR